MFAPPPAGPRPGSTWQYRVYRNGPCSRLRAPAGYAARIVVLMLLALAPRPARAGVEEVAVLQSGRYYGAVEAYRKGEELFLSARDAAGIFGAQLTWLPVAGRVELRFSGRSLRFTNRSNEIEMGGRILKLPSEVFVRGDRAYLPLLAFLTPDFAETAQMEVVYQPDQRLLVVQKRASVRDLHVYSYRDRTRIELELDPGASHKAFRPGPGRLEIQVSPGVLEWPEVREVKDGRLDSVTLTQEARAVRLTVRLSDPGWAWGIGEGQDPHRLLIDITKAPAPGPSASVGPSAAPSALPPLAALPAGARRPLVVIDPGHGGKDSGARGKHRAMEKDITLLIAKDLADLLRRERRFDVLLTRSSDVFIPLAERSAMANGNRGDIFISIHCNAHKSKRESGFEVYFLSDRASDPWAEEVEKAENASLDLEEGERAEGPAALLLHSLARMEYLNEGALLAGHLSKELRGRVGLRDRGIKQASFFVLRWTNTPAVLVETAFLSNTEDLARLQSPRFRRKLAEGLYSGLLKYARSKEWKY